MNTSTSSVAKDAEDTSSAGSGQKLPARTRRKRGE